jgi:hypothetical protein
MLSLANSAVRRTSTGRVVMYVLLALFAAFFAVPIIWLVFEATGVHLGLIGCSTQRSTLRRGLRSPSQHAFPLVTPLRRTSFLVDVRS